MLSGVSLDSESDVNFKHKMCFYSMNCTAVLTLRINTLWGAEYTLLSYTYISIVYSSQWESLVCKRS